MSWNGGSIRFRLYLHSAFFHYRSWMRGRSLIGCSALANEQQKGQNDKNDAHCVQTVWWWADKRLAQSLSGTGTSSACARHALMVYSNVCTWSWVWVRVSACWLESDWRVPDLECVCFVCCVHRVDSDYYEVSVGAAAESSRVLPTVSQPRLQLPSAGHALWCGHGHEAVGIQREARHVYVPGQEPRPPRIWNV